MRIRLYIYKSIRYLKQVEHLFGNILLLDICTLLLDLIRMYAQSCFPINFFNWSTHDQISQRYRLPPAFRPEHLNIIQECKKLVSGKCFYHNPDETKDRYEQDTHIAMLIAMHASFPLCQRPNAWSLYPMFQQFSETNKGIISQFVFFLFLSFWRK